VVVNEGSEEEESGPDGEVQNFSILAFLSCLPRLVLLSWFHRLTRKLCYRKDDRAMRAI